MDETVDLHRGHIRREVLGGLRGYQEFVRCGRPWFPVRKGHPGEGILVDATLTYAPPDAVDRFQERSDRHTVGRIAGVECVGRGRDPGHPGAVDSDVTRIIVRCESVVLEVIGEELDEGGVRRADTDVESHMAPLTERGEVDLIIYKL